MNNPLSIDPECAQLATLIIKQSSQGKNFGFSNRQLKNLKSTDRGRELWGFFNQSNRRGDSSKFDFSQFCRDACGVEYGAARKCFKASRNQYPDEDPRQVCFGEILDLCKRIEFVWTDVGFRANQHPR